MRMLLRMLVLLLLAGVVVTSAIAQDNGVQKVILDTDMVELFDDGMAMVLLDRAPNIDLLGVTVVAGNRTMPAGVAHAARQLEAIGSETPVYEGSRVGFRFWRTDPEILAAEQVLSPVVSWAGYLRDIEGIEGDVLAEWEDLYEHFYGEAPSYPHVYGPGSPDDNGVDEAVEFLINTVNENPGEVTLVVIGPVTNIARAILQDPTFPSKVKQVAYMGGSFYMAGNSSASAEFNWWADPEAVKIALRATWGDPDSESWQSWGNQMISGLEANANTGAMPEDLYHEMVENTFPGLRELFEKRAAPLIAQGRPLPPSNIWDLFAAAWVIDPSIVLSWNNTPRPEDGQPQAIYGVHVDVNTNDGIDYGRSTAFRPNVGPVGTQKAAIQNFIDEDKFWREIVVPLTADPSRQ